MVGLFGCGSELPELSPTITATEYTFIPAGGVFDYTVVVVDKEVLVVDQVAKGSETLKAGTLVEEQSAAYDSSDNNLTSIVHFSNDTSLKLTLRHDANWKLVSARLEVNGLRVGGSVRTSLLSEDVMVPALSIDLQNQ